MTIIEITARKAYGLTSAQQQHMHVVEEPQLLAAVELQGPVLTGLHPRRRAVLSCDSKGPLAMVKASFKKRDISTARPYSAYSYTRFSYTPNEGAS